MSSYYDEYWSDNLIQQGLKDGTLIKGNIRINIRKYEDSFLTDPNGGSDIYINGLKDRNRALNEQVVAVQIKEKSFWKIREHAFDKIIKEFDFELKNGKFKDFKKNKVETLHDLVQFCSSEMLEKIQDEWLQKTGKVVGILEKKNIEPAAGILKLFQDKNKNHALFSPTDSRVPRMKIKMCQCPPDFYTNSKKYQNTLFICKIVDMPKESLYAIGELMCLVGEKGEIETETKAILIEKGFGFLEFSDEVIQSLPQTTWSIPDEEYKTRKNLRNVCVFTIDPATARDLDDALHCIQLEDDLFQIGVHIADVSYFVTEDSPIDKCASDRGTSVYLVQKVIPMLPRLLCEQMCSLCPSMDRLTFSVIWTIKSNGDIVDQWFGRTIINSVAKLNYDHVQNLIENPNEQSNQLPSIRQDFTLEHIKQSILNLHKIAVNLRNKRLENGSLVLNQIKLSYNLSKESGLPLGFFVYEQKDSNILVEEFMLLANTAVAHHIYKKYSSKAILRRHPLPKINQLNILVNEIKSNGFDFDSSTSKSIQQSLQAIKKKDPIAFQALTNQIAKTMQLAEYFCSGNNLSKEKYYHYGLAVPIYTHFTSPIRRYPDIVVHRLMASSLGYQTETSRDSVLLESIAKHCNDKRYSARLCSEQSSEMFFSLFVQERGPFEQDACVIQVNDHSFDVFIVNVGIKRRIYLDKLDIIKDSVIFVRDEFKEEMSFTWNSNEKLRQKITLFSQVKVILAKNDLDKLKFNITLKHPYEQSTCAKLSDKIEEIKEIINGYNNDEIIDGILQQLDYDPYTCE